MGKDLEKYSIRWVDIITETSWMSKEEAISWAEKEPDFVHEIGVILEENYCYLLIAGQWANDGEYGNISRIPKGCIISKTPIEKS